MKKIIQAKTKKKDTKKTSSAMAAVQSLYKKSLKAPAPTIIAFDIEDEREYLTKLLEEPDFDVIKQHLAHFSNIFPDHEPRIKLIIRNIR